jgi:flavin-binding protein dodecin
MYKLLEVVGRSPVSFSEAVKEAVNQVVKLGEVAHYFVVMEQRGLVKDNQLKEFQVTVKIAVDAK